MGKAKTFQCQNHDQLSFLKGKEKHIKRICTREESRSTWEHALGRKIRWEVLLGRFPVLGNLQVTKCSLLGAGSGCQGRTVVGPSQRDVMSNAGTGADLQSGLGEQEVPALCLTSIPKSGQGWLVP